MSQLSFLSGDSPRFSVSELTRYLRGLLELDYRLGDLTVNGEVSNVSRPASGHMYFSLKDAGATLRCVMWRSELARQAFLPSEGQAVEVHGHISLYEASGQYQLYADDIRLGGRGISSELSLNSAKSWKPRGCLRRSGSDPCRTSRA